MSEHRFLATGSTGEVSALLRRPPGAWALYLFAHGAGAGMRHAFMDDVATRLAALGVATFRYQFPYVEAGRKRPDPPAILVKTVRSALAAATEVAGDLPLIAGGKSMGGRMTSTAAASEPLEGVRGLVFFGFPLHAPGRDSAARGEHLSDVGLPMLFLQGTRDKLANLELLEPLLASVEPLPTLVRFEGADHGFHVLKRSGRTDDMVLNEACGQVADWARTLVGTTR